MLKKYYINVNHQRENFYKINRPNVSLRYGGISNKKSWCLFEQQWICNLSYSMCALQLTKCLKIFFISGHGNQLPTINPYPEPYWNLPGRRADPKESAAATAIRSGPSEETLNLTYHNILPKPAKLCFKLKTLHCWYQVSRGLPWAAGRWRGSSTYLSESPLRIIRPAKPTDVNPKHPNHFRNPKPINP